MSFKLPTKQRIFEIITDKEEEGVTNTPFDYFIIILIILNLVAIFAETYNSLSIEYHEFFTLFEYFSVVVFSVEYILRIWTCTYYPEYSRPILGRLKYVFSFMMMIDFLAVFPFFLSILIPLDPRIVKLFRLFRLFRIFKLLRYYGSPDIIITVFKKNREYLFTVFFILIIFLIFVSYLIFILESEVQPDKFGTIDESFWWAVISLTTVGYGDVYPTTLIGKIFTTFILLIGIGMIALPTGIIASGFLEEMRLRKECVLPIRDISIADEILKIKKLKDEGIISEEQFEKIKINLIK